MFEDAFGMLVASVPLGMLLVAFYKVTLSESLFLIVFSDLVRTSCSDMRLSFLHLQQFQHPSVILIDNSSLESGGGRIIQ